ncbi:MAG: hypothetical protein WBC22_12330 [Sedimentisphaerales bacterium]
MTTKVLYKILDKHCPKTNCYNLRKVRNLPVWIVNVWNSEELDKKGILAEYIQGELYPQNNSLEDMIYNFKQFMKSINSTKTKEKMKAG